MSDYDNAIAWAKSRKTISGAAMKQYESTFRNLRRNEAGMPILSANKRTRGVQRSAIRYIVSALILNLLRTGKPEYAEDIIRLHSLIQQIDADANTAYDRALEETRKAKDRGESLPNKQVRKSKRRTLTRLPSNWRELFVAQATSSKYEQAMIIMACCGCRPEEFAKSVEVSRNEATGDTIVKIRGAKIHGEEDHRSGQEWREIVLPKVHPLAGLIHIGTHHYKPRGVKEAAHHWGVKTFGVNAGVTSYSLRHQFAADCKGQGLSMEEIAQALGQSSTATQQMYGSIRQAKTGGGWGIKSVKAASPVRAAKVQVAKSKTSGPGTQRGAKRSQSVKPG